MVKRIHLLLLLFFLCVGTCYADSLHECFSGAANAYHLPQNILVAIAQVESGFNPRAFHRNKDGSADIGLMQINSSHIPFLEKHGIARSALWDSCSNIKIGAWVLATQMAKHGKTWRAVGAYNARSEEKRKVYVHKVWLAMRGAQ